MRSQENVRGLSNRVEMKSGDLGKWRKHLKEISVKAGAVLRVGHKDSCLILELAQHLKKSVKLLLHHDIINNRDANVMWLLFW